MLIKIVQRAVRVKRDHYKEHNRRYVKRTKTHATYTTLLASLNWHKNTQFCKKIQYCEGWKQKQYKMKLKRQMNNHFGSCQVKLVKILYRKIIKIDRLFFCFDTILKLIHWTDVQFQEWVNENLFRITMFTQEKEKLKSTYNIWTLYYIMEFK